MSKRLKDAAALDAVKDNAAKPVETPVSAVDLLVLSDSDSALGQAAWDAYSQSVGGKAFNGDPLPSWGLLREDPRKQSIVKAWVASAQAVVAQYVKSLPKRVTVPPPLKAASAPSGSVLPNLMPLEKRTNCCGALSLSLGKGGYFCPCGDTKVPL